MLDAIGAGLTPRIGGRDWAEIWLESPEHEKALQEIKHIKEEALAKPKDVHHTTTCRQPFILFMFNC